MLFHLSLQSSLSDLPSSLSSQHVSVQLLVVSAPRQLHVRCCSLQDKQKPAVWFASLEHNYKDHKKNKAHAPQGDPNLDTLDTVQELQHLGGPRAGLGVPRGQAESEALHWRLLAKVVWIWSH